MRNEKGQFVKGSNSGSQNVNWKGDKAGYLAVHHWVERQLGKPKKCAKCGTTERRVYHWANISGKYLREISDWLRLCVSCHRHMDMTDEWRKNLSIAHTGIKYTRNVQR